MQCRVSDKLTEDDFRGSQTIEDELEALRSSSHLSAMKRIERGRGTDRSAEPRVGLRSVFNCCESGRVVDILLFIKLVPKVL